MTYLFVYRMTDDTGFAPCAEKGLLSLSCCKGGQMRGDKIIHTGLRHRIGSKRESDYSTDDVYILGTYHNKLLYLARITDVVTMEEYFGGMSKGRTDDIYSLVDGHLMRNSWLYDQGVHTENGRIIRDIAGQYVLLSKDYVYLGADAVKIDMITKYNAKGQETKVYTGKTADMIVTECKKHDDGKRHKPHVPYKSGGCK